MEKKFCYIEIFRYSDGEVVRRMDVTGESEHNKERIIRGASINNNHDKYGIVEMESETELPKI